MHRVLRYLRFAFSAVCGIACVLLIALWVRSNWYWDELYNPISNKHLIVVESASGRALLDLTGSSPGSPWYWHISEPLHGRYWGGPLDDFAEANRNQGIAGFAAYGNPWHVVYRAPLWFAVIVCAMVAAVPWLPWSNRFSLRTVLIITAVLAVFLVFAAHIMKVSPAVEPPSWKVYNMPGVREVP
jgi:hypothetical protein